MLSSALLALIHILQRSGFPGFRRRAKANLGVGMGWAEPINFRAGPGWAFGPWAEKLEIRKKLKKKPNFSKLFTIFDNFLTILLLSVIFYLLNFGLCSVGSSFYWLRYEALFYSPIWARFYPNGPAHGLGRTGLGFFDLSPAQPRPKKSGPCPSLGESGSMQRCDGAKRTKVSSGRDTRNETTTVNDHVFDRYL